MTQVLAEPVFEGKKVLKVIPKGKTVAILEEKDVRAGMGLIRFYKVNYEGVEGWVNEYNTTGKILTDTPSGHVESPIPGAEGPRMVKEDAASMTKEEADARATELSKSLLSKLKARSAGESIFKSVRVRGIGSTWEATIVVDNAWTNESYDDRLELAKAIWQTWYPIANPSEPDKAPIAIEASSGRKVGGSRTLGGSLIWVEK